ncbi:predicted protein [Arabidopsis lyrata subsp. lyrata]|uniref:Predicted protein n=1 Tax=Arabidopsis lyrata subsp. lyrata TaxID=81972 RepID=D7LJU0_ARALL|nr:predicted protein [Arabidopsis lyrata subsp. lyrata]
MNYGGFMLLRSRAPQKLNGAILVSTTISKSDDEAELYRSADSIFDCTRTLDGSIPVVSIPMDFDSVSCTSSTSWETDTDPDNSSDPGNLDLSSLTFE